LSHLESVLCALALLIIWEFFEYLTSPVTNFGKESLLNKASDIVIGFGAFFLTFFFLNRSKKKDKKRRKKPRKS
jgi:hypothetical protein